MIKLIVNGREYKVDAGQDVPLLWVIRGHLKMTDGRPFSSHPPPHFGGTYYTGSEPI